MLTDRSDGQRPTSFTAAILAGPVRSLEQWGALTADDWATAGVMMDENPHWNIQHVIEHFVGPRTSPPTVEPAAVVDHLPVPPVEPATAVDYPVSTSKRSLRLPGPVRKRPRTAAVVQAEIQELEGQVRVLAAQVQEQLLELSLPAPELAVEPEPKPAVLVPALPVFNPKQSLTAALVQAEIQALAGHVRGQLAQVRERVLALRVPTPELAVEPEPEPELPVSIQVVESRPQVPPPELQVFLPVPPALTFLPPVLEWNLATEALQRDQALERLAAEAPLVPGPLAGTYVLTPIPLWEARHDLPPDLWAPMVTALVKAHGPFPVRTVIIVAIRFSRGSDLSKEQYHTQVNRCVEAASTLIRHIRSLPGQADRQFLIYPWIRTNISSANDWFKYVFNLAKYRRGIPRTTHLSCKLKELEFVLDNVQPDTKVWWLSIGIDGLTTDIENLRRVQTRWPALDFTLAVMVHKTFLPNVAKFGGEDICPPRPAAAGIRIRIYSFARLLTGAHVPVDRPARKLLAVFRHINDGKLSGASYDLQLAHVRNTMPVSPGGIDSWGRTGDRM